MMTALAQRNFAQIIEALTCPVNRDATRRKHNCDDWELFRHPELLITNYAQNGGAEAFAKSRGEFWPEPDYQI